MAKINNQYSVNKLSINKVNLMSFKVEGVRRKIQMRRKQDFSV